MHVHVNVLVQLLEANGQVYEQVHEQVHVHVHASEDTNANVQVHACEETILLLVFGSLPGLVANVFEPTKHLADATAHFFAVQSIGGCRGLLRSATLGGHCCAEKNRRCRGCLRRPE